MSAKPMRPRVVRMPDEMFATVERIAEAEDRSASWIIRRALRQYIDRHPAPVQQDKETERP